MGIIKITDDYSIYQYLNFIKLQFDNDFEVNDDFETLYYDYLEYCKRNKLISVTRNKFGKTFNNLGMETKSRWDSDLGKSINYKDVTKENVENALKQLGGEMIIEDIQTILNNKRYKIQIKIIPLETPDLDELEMQSLGKDLLTRAESDHSDDAE